MIAIFTLATSPARHSVQHSSSSDNIRLLPCSGRSQATVQHSADTLYYSILPSASLALTLYFFKGVFFICLKTRHQGYFAVKNGPPIFLVEHMLQILFSHRKVVPKINKSHIFVACRVARASALTHWATSPMRQRITFIKILWKVDGALGKMDKLV